MQDGHGIHLLAWDSVCLPVSEGGLGIQSLIVRREALMARHASRFLLDPHCFWSSFMRARYGGWTPLVDFQPSRRYSSFWKEICRHAPLIMDNISWMIGDGSSVDVIQDTWIAELPLSLWPTFISMEVPSSMRVIDLMAEDHNHWHIPTVTRFFGKELASRVFSIPLIPGYSSDTSLWKRSCTSTAPIRDLLRIYRPHAQHMTDTAWIWKHPIHPRIQLFLWKLAWDCLPTCSLLAGRGLSIQATCPLCGQEDETIDHAIFRCPRARHIWLLMGYHFRDGNDGSRRDVLLGDIRRGTRRQGALWAGTAYQIWLSRNLLVFTEDAISPRRVVRKIISFFEEFTFHGSTPDSDSHGLWGSSAASAANRHTVFISWEPPPSGYVKINFDGSVRGRCAGSAFVIRGTDGALVAAGGFSLLDSSVPLAELYAAWAGITFAARCLHAHYLFIEGDSMTVIRWIRQDPSANIPSNPLLHDIWSAIREVHTVQIRHIYREANAAADWVAASAAYHSGAWTWEQGAPCPIILQQILVSDVSGLTRARIV